MSVTDVYDDLILQASVTYNVPFHWIKAIIGAESNFNPNAYRTEPKINDASYGLMQILYSTAVSLGYTGPPEGLFDPMTNIGLGTKYLAQLIKHYGSSSFERIYSAYNSGSPDKYLTNSEVAQHVRNAVAWLEKVSSVVTENPTATGLVTLVIAGLIIYYLTRRKRS